MIIEIEGRDYEIICSRCGSSIEFGYTTKGQIHNFIEVSPCEKCLDTAIKTVLEEINEKTGT